MRKLYIGILLGLSALILPCSSFADTVTLGTLSYDTSIPAGPLGPGVNAIDILNLTAGGDFLDANGISSAVTFTNLIASVNGGSAQPLGSLAPGDFSLFPAILVPPSDLITSILLTGTLDTTNALNASGMAVNLQSSFSVVLNNADNSPLVADQSLVPITVVTVAAPEPSASLLMGVGFLFILILANKKHFKRAA